MRGQTQSHIFLIGFQGSGKTTVGQIVARHLGWQFIDVDAEVVRTAGQPIHEIRDSMGLEGHRNLESQVISQPSHDHRSVVVSGASSVMDDRFWRLAQEMGITIHLNTRPETILRRLERKYGGLPWIASPDDPVGSVARRKAERQPRYSEADFMVDTDGRSPEEVAERVLKVCQTAIEEGP